MRRRQTWIAVGALCALSLPGPAKEPRKGREKKAPAAPIDLVWPGPPEQPRIRFVAAITSADDVRGPVKLSLAERLAGRPPARNQFSLGRPYGVAVDRSGNIYVADAAQRSVLVYNREARTVARWGGNAQFPLFAPAGVAIEAGGRLFVSDSLAGQIVVFNATGKPVAGFGKGLLKRPAGLAVDSSRGRLYVADVVQNQVFFFHLQTLKLEKTIGGSSTPETPEPGLLSGPSNLAVNSRGRLYVTDTWNRRVQAFAPDGRFVLAFGTPGIRPGDFARPKGIAIDSEDHVYVADAEFNNFQVFSPEGRPLLFVGSAGDAPGQFVLPAGIAIDRNDRIFVIEQRLGGGRLQVFQYLPEQPPAASTAKVNP